VVLLLPHSFWDPRQDFRCILGQCVTISMRIFFCLTKGCISVPNPVLGGVTTFLFASVATSGVRVLAYSEFTRRDRFVIAAALSFGLGNLLVPTIFTHLFDGVRNPSKGLGGFIDAVDIILSTPCMSHFLLFFVKLRSHGFTSFDSRYRCCGAKLYSATRDYHQGRRGDSTRIGCDRISIS
jgi:Permease family